MALKSLLLVTGSRALADYPEAQDWAETQLAGRIGTGDWGVVLNGGCPLSPDAWSTDIAARAGVAWVEYRLDGHRYGSDGKTKLWVAERSDRKKPHPHPHERNQAMVDLGRRMLADGWRVLVLGLVAPWSKTRGTQVTIGMAQQANLPLEEPPCPAIVTAKPCTCGRGMTRTFDAWVCSCGRHEAR